jgi:outer membrane protein OmpA-like peptidoglycan-associated protein
MVALGSYLLCGPTAPQGCQPAPQPSHAGADAAAIAIIAGVIIGTVVLVEVHKSHHTIKGCVSTGPNGLQLENMKDRKTYMLLGATSKTHVGDIVQLRGDKERADKGQGPDGGETSFVVKKMKRDYGPCDYAPEPAAASASLGCVVVDGATHAPIAGATVVAGAGSATTDANGNCVLNNLAAGPATITATAAGYEQKALQTDLESEAPAQLRFELRRHREASDLESAIGQNGSAALLGVQFDTNSATLRPDSTPTLNKALAVILKRPNSHWIVAGHTDSQGSEELNQKLSEARAAAVVAWLESNGVDQGRLQARGYGAARPVADNSTEQGRAQNRRVELVLVKPGADR